MAEIKITKKNMYKDIYNYCRNNSDIRKELVDYDALEIVFTKLLKRMTPLLFRELTQKQRDIITLYYGHCLSQLTIAETLGITQSTVSVLLNRALVTLNEYSMYIYNTMILLESNNEKEKDQ